jgi:hypothetical protein
MKKEWELYEEAAQSILNRFRKEFGLERIEGKQSIEGIGTGTTWEIDAKGVCEESEAYVLIECRRYKKNKQNQEQIAALAFRVKDTGSVGGIIVSPLGLQTGAKLVANANSIVEVKLHENSTPETFMIEFLGKVVHGFSAHLKSGPATVRGVVQVISTCRKCGGQYVKHGDSQLCETCDA